MSNEQVVLDPSSIGIKVKLVKDYALVCETLERIGVVNHKEKIIYPSCYCRKVESSDGPQYTICHFKEMFSIQGKPSSFTNVDSLRRCTITYLLQKWGLIQVVDSNDVSKILDEKIDVVAHKDKNQYKIIHKFKQHRNP
jgi:hypothetical protein